MKIYIILFFTLSSFCVFSQNITSINPNQAMQGQTIPLIISGNNMSFSGWSCWSNTGNLSDFRFSQWSAMNILYGTPVSVTTNSMQLNGTLSVPAFQPTGIYNLEVFDCVNSWWIQFPNSFQITAAATASWDCVNNTCVDPGTGNGMYFSLALCNAACFANAVDEEISNLLIYPSPVKNTLIIDGNYTSATIYNVFGVVVLTTDSYQNTIDVTALKSGIYFVYINIDNLISVKKITIAK